ncbi:TatD family deoxyribonuclease [Geovibrio thiophilus]|uniref:TatD family deoxyribonuclease n=1 Tax=Geovibrio thiophilus TaxID=139438 RepID=A0A3R5UW09_9BACT|nr:TatD family hydrolase [Geovibrio thiophilus]QAR31889.1 TatD family deoxyribonuclease [Geovibrio thiophilus]
MISKKDTPEHREFLDKLAGLNGFFTDSHAHVHMQPLSEDADAVLLRAAEHKIGRIVTIGIDVEDSRRAADFAAKHSNVYAAVGVHPHDTKDFPESGLDSLRELLKAPKVIALGEIGLDFYYDHSPRETQEKCFASFLAIAEETGMPVIIHNRDSTARLTEIMKAELPPREKSGIIHCFSGDTDLLRYALDNGFYISYAGVVTYPKSEELRRTLQFVSKDRLLIETDAPYLAPAPYRGRTNEPAYTAYTAETIAAELGMSLEKTAELLESNFQSLFGDRL